MSKISYLDIFSISNTFLSLFFDFDQGLYLEININEASSWKLNAILQIDQSHEYDTLF